MNKKLKTQLIYLTLILCAVSVFCMSARTWIEQNSSTYTIYAQEGVEADSQEPIEESAVTGKEATTPQPKSVIEETVNLDIEEEIKEVFGEYADTAFLLLRGDGTPGACAENKTLDPEAVNRNWTDTEGVYSSTDRGVFQINDKWQGITHEGKAEQFLFDPSINIRIAWRLFEDSGYSFNLWTCGKVYGI